MFRSSSPGFQDDPQVQRLLAQLAQELFGDDRSPAQVDFATIERRAHEAGQWLARRLCEQTASDQAQATDGPWPCPDCGRPCDGTLEGRPLLTRDGPIELDERRCTCPSCRRAFFPQPTGPTSQSSPVQPGGSMHRRDRGDRHTLVRGGGQVADDRRQIGDLAASSPNPLPGRRRRTGR